MLNRAQIVYHTNMNTYKGAKERVELAIKVGKVVNISYVYRDPVEALVNGALPRAAQHEKDYGSGRTVPPHERLKTNEGSYDVVKRLADEYKGNPMVSINLIDNSNGKGGQQATTFEKLAAKRDTWKKDLIHELKKNLRQARKDGKISDAIYKGFAGEDY